MRPRSDLLSQLAQSTRDHPLSVALADVAGCLVDDLPLGATLHVTINHEAGVLHRTSVGFEIDVTRFLSHRHWAQAEPPAEVRMRLWLQEIERRAQERHDARVLRSRNTGRAFVWDYRVFPVERRLGEAVEFAARLDRELEVAVERALPAPAPSWPQWGESQIADRRERRQADRRTQNTVTPGDEWDRRSGQDRRAREAKTRRSSA